MKTNSMRRLMMAGVFIGTMVSFSSCLKSEIENVPPPSTTVPQGELARIEWDNGVIGYFDYKAGGSILNSIQYNFGGSTGKTTFEWSGSQMISIADDRSANKNVYTYGGPSAKVTSVQNVPRNSGAPVFQIDYIYRQDGKVDSMKYFSFNGSTKKLETRTGYTYAPSGELTEANTVTGDNAIRTLIQAWSQEVQFSPQMYLDVTLSDNYIVYNLPVLTQSNRLPAKITRMVKLGAADYTTDKVQDIEYTISGSKVAKSKTTITFPAVPGGNTVVEAKYIYQP